jgi:hypothetical protein
VYKCFILVFRAQKSLKKEVGTIEKIAEVTSLFPLYGINPFLDQADTLKKGKYPSPKNTRITFPPPHPTQKKSKKRGENWSNTFSRPTEKEFWKREKKIALARKKGSLFSLFLLPPYLFPAPSCLLPSLLPSFSQTSTKDKAKGLEKEREKSQFFLLPSLLLSPMHGGAQALIEQTGPRH